jgi:hypothetical protein
MGRRPDGSRPRDSRTALAHNPDVAYGQRGRTMPDVVLRAPAEGHPVRTLIAVVTEAAAPSATTPYFRRDARRTRSITGAL